MKRSCLAILALLTISEEANAKYWLNLWPFNSSTSCMTSDDFRMEISTNNFQIIGKKDVPYTDEKKKTEENIFLSNMDSRLWRNYKRSNYPRTVYITLQPNHVYVENARIERLEGKTPRIVKDVIVMRREDFINNSGEVLSLFCKIDMLKEFSMDEINGALKVYRDNPKINLPVY